MPAFTTEENVRRRLQAEDTTNILPALVAAAIDDAHAVLLRRLDPAWADAAPPAELELGECLLAGAYLLHALASRDAIEQHDFTIGGQRIMPGTRFASLTAMADLAERRAWHALEPYLAAVAQRSSLELNASAPVFGQE